MIGQALVVKCDQWDRWGMCYHDPQHRDTRSKAVAHICSVFGCGEAVAPTIDWVEMHYRESHDGLPPLLQTGPAYVTLRKIV
jgi:hypothetical protein